MLCLFAHLYRNPDVGMGGLSDIATFGNFYMPPDDRTVSTYITDFTNRCWHKISATRKDKIAAEIADAISAVEGEAITAIAAISGASSTYDELLDSIAQYATDQLQAASGGTTQDARDAVMKAALSHMHIHAIYTAAEPLPAAQQFAAAQAVIADWNKRGLKLAKMNEALNSGVACILRPRMEAIMSSAVLAAPGSETGELLIGYP